MADQRANFLSASEVPVKLFYMRDQIIVDGNIRPIHLGLHPTNRCNANCPWCSHHSCNRSLEMPIEEVREIAAEFSKLGTKAVTISGGGEPTLHRSFPEILAAFYSHDIQIGLSTNGIKLRDSETIDLVNRFARWVRISCHLQMSLDDLGAVCDKITTDLGLSLVISDHTAHLAIEACKLAESRSNVIYIRLVQEICDLDGHSMEVVANSCNVFPKAIIQWRNNYTVGSKKCLFSRMRPLIDCTGSIYPCCGTQYAMGNQGKINPEFCMGNWRDYARYGVFNGSKCSKCYYDNYNRVLLSMLEPPIHPEFV